MDLIKVALDGCEGLSKVVFTNVGKLSNGETCLVALDKPCVFVRLSKVFVVPETVVAT